MAKGKQSCFEERVLLCLARCWLDQRFTGFRGCAGCVDIPVPTLTLFKFLLSGSFMVGGFLASSPANGVGQPILDRMNRAGTLKL